MSILSQSKVKSVTEFAADLSDAVRKNNSLIEALRDLSPHWLEAAGEAAAESLPLIRFVVKLAEKLPPAPTPKELGLLACTLAFQKAVAEALLLAPQKNRVPFADAAAGVKSAAMTWKLDDAAIMTGFSLEHPASHPFVLAATEALREPIRAAGYDQAESRIIAATIYERFKERLRDLVSDPKLKEKFAPFVQWAQLGSEEDRAYYALQEHAARQRSHFRDEPVLGNEPFALAQVYIETDCGDLAWQQIHAGKLDPFQEENGGRKPLLDTVLAYLKRNDFTDAVVIQGGPGAGKSAFTLRLSDELIRLGLSPIRIRLRNLRVDLPLLKALARAVVAPDSGKVDLRKIPRPNDALLDGRVFDEPTRFGSAVISRYVLILDGWDEVSTAERGYQIQVAELLQRVRSEFLEGRAPLVRVVLTGRPSDAIAASNFLNDDTPILTVRPYTPDQLEAYVSRLRGALEAPPVVFSEESESPPERWSLPAADHFAAVLERYRTSRKQLEVLGQPLLAHLAVRVMAECRSKQELQELIETPTRLYRSLVDLTCGKAGKAAQDRGDDPQQARIRGLDLRRKLHKTAAAITAHGHESIPFRELMLRAGFRSEDREDLTTTSRRDRPWTKLMLSFYFKGGAEHHGCEFLHKSFREYLFAEGIVETLKEHAVAHQGEVALRRASYWKDFERVDGDERYNLSRALGELLSPQWLSPEVIQHLEHLISWEILTRSKEPEGVKSSGTPTVPIPLERWGVARELLAALWDWWGEGAHLRPQPRRSEETGDIELRPPFVERLVNLAMVRDRSGDKQLPIPIRTTTVDGHLGEALFRLTELVHYCLALATGWKGQWEIVEERPYQVVVADADGGVWMMFAPSGQGSRNFRNYVNRINAVGWRGLFPSGVRMRGLYLAKTDLTNLFAWGADLRGSMLGLANLSGSIFFSATLDDSVLDGVDASLASFHFARLENASFHHAGLAQAHGLEQVQIDSAQGDDRTRLPPGLERPAHWIPSRSKTTTAPAE